MAEGVASSDLNGRQKAAILAISLGREGAAEVFKYLREDQIERLALEMARMDEIASEQAEAVRREMIESALARGYLRAGGVSYARDVLSRALGDRRAAEILDRLAAAIETPFDFLRSTPPEQIATFLAGEHPQTAALVLANLPSSQLAARVIQLLGPEQQADVALRIAQMGKTPPDVVKEVARITQQKLESVLHDEYALAGGVGTLAQIINSSDRGTERIVLEHLASKDEELADEVRSLLFVFEDILKLDDRAIQLVLKEVDSKELALALRGSSDEVKQRILANLSQRGAEMLAEEMEFMPPQRRKVVEAAQSKIVAAVRRLEEAGEIAIAGEGGGDDELIS